MTDKHNSLAEVISGLIDADDTEVTPAVARILYGMRLSGVTIKKDRRRRRAYVEVRLTRIVPLDEMAVDKPPAERR